MNHNHMSEKLIRRLAECDMLPPGEREAARKAMTQLRFIATAEHTAGASVAHPCRSGAYSDPCDDFQQALTADTLEAAEQEAEQLLERAVRDSEPCTCALQLQPGSDRWWRSVAIHLWPQNEAALAAWIEQGGDPAYDPYGLIPAEWKADDADEVLD